MEVLYYSTPIGFYFEQTDGFIPALQKDGYGEECYLFESNTIRRAHAYTYINNGYLYDVFSNPQHIYYAAHTHPRNTPIGSKDAFFSGDNNIPLYAIGYNGNISGAYGYNNRYETNLSVRNLNNFNTLRHFRIWKVLNPKYITSNIEE